MAVDPRKRHGLDGSIATGAMDASNPLQQLLVRGLGTTSLVAERLRSVTQAWVSSGRLDPSQATALVDDVLASLRGENPELEKQTERQVGRNLDHLLQDLGLARQREVDELRGRIDRLEQKLRGLSRDASPGDTNAYGDLPD